MKDKLDLEAILEKVQKITPGQWKDRFRRHDVRRIKKNKEMESVLLYLLDECLLEIYELVYSFYGQYAKDGIVPDEVARVRMDSKEILALIAYLNNLLDLAGASGIRFDKDIEETIEALTVKSNVTRVEGLILKMKARIEYCYGNIEKRMASHIKDVGDEAYYTTVYEIFRATGHGVAPDDEVLIPLAMLYAWRSNGESFDETIWRYKRELEFNLERELKRSSFTKANANTLLEKVSAYFKRDNKNLKAMASTDSTFASTLAQENAFSDFDIEECLYCTIDDERRSEICAELDGSVVPVDQIEPWVNAPPMHYNCRSWLTPIIESVDYLNGGKVYDMEGMDFSTWYDTWV